MNHDDGIALVELRDEPAGHTAGRAPTQDHLLVFYLPDEVEWRAAVARLERAGHTPVAAFNPYWDRQGRTFEDRPQVLARFGQILARINTPA